MKAFWAAGMLVVLGAATLAVAGVLARVAARLFLLGWTAVP